MGGEEAAAMLPKERPDAFNVCLRKLCFGQFGAGEEAEYPLTMLLWQSFESRFNFKKEHEPVRLALVTVFADQPREVKVARLEPEAKFLFGFAAGAGVRGFAGSGIEFSTARTPTAAVWFPGALDEQYFVFSIKTIKQRGDLIRQTHWGE